MAGTLNVTADRTITSLTKGTSQVSLQRGVVEVAMADAKGVAFLIDGAQEVDLHGTRERPLELGGMTGAVPVHQRKPVRVLRLTDVAVRNVSGADGLHLVNGTHILTRVLVSDVNRGSTTDHSDGLSIMGVTSGCRINLTMRNARAMILGPQDGKPSSTGSEAATVANAHTDMQWLDSDIRGATAFVDLFCAPGVVFDGGFIQGLQLQRLQGAAGGVAPKGSGPTDGTTRIVLRNLEVPVLQLGAGSKDTGRNAASIMGWGGDLDLMFDADRCGGCKIGRITGSDGKREAEIRAILERPFEPVPDPDPVPVPDPVPLTLEDRVAALEAWRQSLQTQAA